MMILDLEEAASSFSATELEQIDKAALVSEGWGKTTALDMAVAWSVHVRKFDADRILPWDNHHVWNEYDLVAALIIRSRLESAIMALSAGLRARVSDLVEKIDERFRSFTVEDSGVRITRISEPNASPPVPVPDGWWWHRVPFDGPIAKDFAHYDAEGNWVGYGDDWPPSTAPEVH